MCDNCGVGEGRYAASWGFPKSLFEMSEAVLVDEAWWPNRIPGVTRWAREYRRAH